MNKRYSSVFTMPDDLYTAGSPVVIAAGALLKDNLDGRVLVRLKLQNVTSRKIRAVRVRIMQYDSFFRPIGSPVEKQYIDLLVPRDTLFGQDIPVYLPDDTTRAYKASVAEVAFEDMTIWECSPDAKWKPIPAPKSQAEAIPDLDLCERFSAEYGGDMMPMDYADLWFCTCGAVNLDVERRCHICGCPHEKLQNIDLDELAANRKWRIEETHETGSVWRKLEIAGGAAALCAVILIIALLAGRGNRRKESYYNAFDLMNAGSYEEAIAGFEALQDYRDADSMADMCRYKAAEALLDDGDYDAAIDAFEALGDYSDSADRVRECKYASAVALMDEGSYDEAKAIFEALGDYSDSEDMIEICENGGAAADEDLSAIERLMRYIQDNAGECELDTGDDDAEGSATVQDGCVVCRVTRTKNKTEYTTTLKIDPDSRYAEFEQENTRSGHSGGTTIAGTIEPEEYEDDGDLNIIEADDDITDDDTDTVCKGIDEALEGLDGLLREMDLTIEDIGFTSY